MGMGTHTMTKVGVVRNTCNKQVMYSIILLEKELREVYFQIKACHENGLTAFLSHFEEQMEHLRFEIRSLLTALCYNITTLTR
jgi:hypothetical protein